MDAPPTSKSPRRWHQRRALRCVAVLLAVGVGAYFFWDPLFMPADLRRLQGNWKRVRELANGQEVAPGFDRVIITGRGLEVVSRDVAVSFPMYIVPERRELCVYEEYDTKILGLTVRLPI